MSKRDDGPAARLDARPKQELRADIEAGFFGVVCGYEAIAIALRKTRWTKFVPPLTRLVTKHPVAENSTVLGLKYHFIRARKRGSKA